MLPSQSTRHVRYVLSFFIGVTFMSVVVDSHGVKGG
jgi:hypothetical protein